MPNLSSVQVNTAISAFASGYENRGFIADALAPVVETEDFSGIYFTRDRMDSATPYDDLLGPNSEPATVDYSTAQQIFKAIPRGLMSYVPYAVIDANKGPSDPRESYAKNILQRLKLKQEIRVATLMQTNANFAQTQAATAVFTDQTTGNPVADFQAAVSKLAPGDVGESKVVAGMALETFQALAAHTKVLALRAGGRIKDGLMDGSELAAVLGVDEIWVSDAEKNTAARGATPVYARVWDKTKIPVVRVPKSVPTQVENLSLFAAQFRWKGANQFPWEAIEWEEPKRGPGKGSVGVKISHWTAEVRIQNDAGVLITSAMS